LQRQKGQVDMSNETPHVVQMGLLEDATVGTFTFSNDAAQMPVDAELMKDLSAHTILSEEDTGVVRHIISRLTEDGNMPFPWTQQEANYISHNSQDKWVEYFIYRYKFFNYPRNKTLPNFPIYMLIEPMSVCNLRCVMCFQVDKSFTRKPFMGMMDIDLYKNVVDQAVAGGTKAVTLASRGEPTLHPELPEMLDYASDKFIELKLTTNATRLTEELCHRILSSSVNILVFSVDAHTKHLYEEIRVRGDFDIVLENIKRFHEIRKSDYPDSNISTRISAVKFREDQDSEKFTSFWSQIVDEVGMKDAQTRWDTYGNSTVVGLNSACNVLWERLYVWFDGTTNPCDIDYKSHLSGGKVGDMSIQDIWLGPEMTNLRKAHLEGLRKEHSPCDRCGMNFE
jgi:organic radical activating enzyme